MYTEDNMRMDIPRPNNGTRKDRKENIDMSMVSNKSKQIPGSLIREMFAMQAGMKDVISFALGEPDFTAPQHVIDATVDSFRRGETHYTPNTGIPSLRKAVAATYQARGLDYQPSEILIGAGAISLLNLSLIHI